MENSFEKINNTNKEKQDWTPEAIDIYYQEMLAEALDSFSGSAVMVVGPMFILRSPEENFDIFKSAQAELENKGVSVFNQVPFLDYNQENAPFAYDRKFDIFYKGIISSGRINKLYVLPDYDQSKGTLTEISFAQDNNIEVEYLT